MTKKEKITTAIVLFLVLFLSVNVIQSQEPSPAPPILSQAQQNKTKPKQTKSNDHQRGPDELPLVVKVIRTEESKSKENPDTKNAGGDATTNWLLVVFNGLLALFTFGLYQSTNKMWKSTKDAADAAKKAADVAELSVQAVIRMELPVIDVIPTRLIRTDKLLTDNGPYCGGALENALPTKYSATDVMNFRNYGRSPVFPESLSVGWIAADKLPDQPIYIKSSPISRDDIIQPNGEMVFETRYGIELTDQELRGINEGKFWLWFYGCFYYRDFMNEKRETRFCWKFVNRSRQSTYIHYGFSSDITAPTVYTKNI